MEFTNLRGYISSHTTQKAPGRLHLTGKERWVCVLLYLAGSLVLDLGLLKSTGPVWALFGLDIAAILLAFFCIGQMPVVRETTWLEEEDESSQPALDLQTEISARWHAEEQRRDTDRRLASFVESMALGVVYVDDQGTLLSCNPAAERMLGLQPGEGEGQKIDDKSLRIQREDGTPFPLHERPSVKALRTGLPVRDVVMGIHNFQRDETRWLLVSATPEFRHRESTPYQACSTFEDITDKRNQKNEIQLKSAALDAVLWGAPVILWAADTNGVVTLSEGKQLAVLGLKGGEEVGKSLFDSYLEYPTILENIERALLGEDASYEIEFAGVHFQANILPQRDEWGDITGIIGIAIDTTESKLVEAELRREREALQYSDALLAEAQRLAHVGSWELDPASGRLTWSDELYRIYGLDPSEGTPSMETMAALHFPDDWAFLNERVKSMFVTGIPCEMDMRCIQRGGEIRWCHVTIQLSTVRGSDSLRVVGATADITDRRRAETAMREAEKRHRFALDSGKLGTWDLDITERSIVSISETKKRLFGYGPDDDFAWEDYLKSIHVEDRSRVMEALERAIRERRSAGVEYRVVLPDGSIRWLLSHGSVFIDDVTRRPRLIGVSKDITERYSREAALRESEQRQRLALESSQLGAWDLDVSLGEFISISDACLKLYGRSAGEAFTWNDCIDAIHPEDRPVVFEAISRVIANRESDKVEYRVVLPDGTIRWLLSHGTLVVDAPADQARLIGVTQDITDRRNREDLRVAELQKAHDRADRDPLTNLLNHRAFYRQLDVEAARVQADGTALAIVLLDLDNFKFFNDAYSHPVGDEVLREVSERLKVVCGRADTSARFGGDEFAMLLTGFDVGSDAAKIQTDLQAQMEGLKYQPTGTSQIIPITATVGVSLLWGDNASLDRHEAVERADEQLRRAKSGNKIDDELHRVQTLGQQIAGFAMLDALVTAVDSKDRYTRRHSEDVMKYSLMLGRELKLDEEAMATVAMAALLHDVGKIGIPDAILRKPAALTTDEYETIKQHPQMGAVIVGAIPGLEAALGGIRCHHERWDGRGYPDGIVGEESPLIARIISVADAYSAMTTNRPYRDGMEKSGAEAILQAGAGSQWDPACVTAFLACLRHSEQKAAL